MLQALNLCRSSHLICTSELHEGFCQQLLLQRGVRHTRLQVHALYHNVGHDRRLFNKTNDQPEAVMDSLWLLVPATDANERRTRGGAPTQAQKLVC